MATWQQLFPGVTEAQWRDWRWQQRHALRTAEELARVAELTADERAGIAATAGIFRLGVTPYYASLIDRHHPYCPVRMQAIPVAAEAEAAPGDLRDPLGEDPHRPVRALVHKYPDRALLLATDTCPVYCRHCTRRRITGGAEEAFDREAIQEALDYLGRHPEVRDVIVSGGDPLVLSDERLGWVLAGVRAIPHVQILRLATRGPVTCPMRVDDALCRLLRSMKPLFLVTHFNHAKECTPEARDACERLVDHGVPVENQTVLLRRLNSSARAIADLNHRLLSWRVRPYYLHQGDLAQGTGHLRTPLSAGVGILEQLRGHTSGLAVPHLAVDLPGGGGKVTLQPDYLLAREPGGTWFRGFRGGRYHVPEPPAAEVTCPYEEVFYGAQERQGET